MELVILKIKTPALSGYLIANFTKARAAYYCSIALPLCPKMEQRNIVCSISIVYIVLERSVLEYCKMSTLPINVIGCSSHVAVRKWSPVTAAPARSIFSKFSQTFKIVTRELLTPTYEYILLRIYYQLSLSNNWVATGV